MNDRLISNKMVSHLMMDSQIDFKHATNTCI